MSEENTILPYVNAYNNLEKLITALVSATVPPKFNNDFIYSVLGLKSTSYRPMVPLLRKLEFIDSNNAPTQAYKDFRDPTKSKYILANQIKIAYLKLFEAHEYAQKLDKDELLGKIKTITGWADTDQRVGATMNTFQKLVSLADFGQMSEPKKDIKETVPKKLKQEIVAVSEIKSKKTIGLSYTINLNLPPTTDIEVFNAIFKSLKENILDE